jgi:hypothetical protein
MLGSNPGLLKLVHWKSDALTTRLDLIRTRLDLIRAIVVSLGSEERRGRKERGFLLLFTPLWLLSSNKNYTCKVVQAHRRTHKCICMVTKSGIGLFHECMMFEICLKMIMHKLYNFLVLTTSHPAVPGRIYPYINIRICGRSSLPHSYTKGTMSLFVPKCI